MPGGLKKEEYTKAETDTTLDDFLKVLKKEHINNRYLLNTATKVLPCNKPE